MARGFESHSLRHPVRLEPCRQRAADRVSDTRRPVPIPRCIGLATTPVSVHDSGMIRRLLRWLALLLCFGGDAMAAGFGSPIVERIEPARLGGIHPMGFAAHEDAQGLIHLANVDGLVRVAGNRTQLFPLGSSAVVRTLLPRGERLAVGGYDAYGEFGRDADGNLRMVDLSARRDGEPLGTVWRLLDWRGSLVVITSGRLLIHAGDSVRELATPARVTTGFLFEDRVYLRADGLGLIVLDEDEAGFTVVAGTATLSDGMTRSPLPWRDGVLLAHEKHGLLHFDGREVRAWPAQPLARLQSEQPYALHALTDGRLLVGTLAGRLHLIDAEGRWLQSHDVVAAPILGISETREGGLLVSTERGLYRVYWPSAWERTGAEQGVEGTARSLHRRQAGIWLTTSTGLYWRSDAGGATAPFERLTREIIDLQALDWVAGVPVLASELGVHRWLGDRLGPALDRLGSCYGVLPSERHPGRFYSACDEGLLIGEAGEGELKVLATAGGSLSRIAALAEVASDRLLVTLLDGGPREVQLGADGTIERDREVGDALSTNALARVLYTARAGTAARHRLLADGRVWAWTGSGWDALSDPWPTELGDGQDFLVLIDDLGSELLISRRGLALRPADTREWRRVSLPGGDGVQLSGGALAEGLFLWDHERVWHAPLGPRGFAALFTAPVPMQVQADRLQLRDADGSRALSPVQTELESLSIGSQLTIDFSLPTLAQPVEFRSRLGSPAQPGEFSAWTADATRILPPLPRGRFRFEVEGRNALGIRATPYRLDFRIVAPWWHSRMLQLLGGFALLALLASGLLILRSVLLKRRNRQLEQLVLERTEALSAANQQLLQLADSDGLTGLLNRRRFDADWAEALRAAAATRQPVALLLVDLDHFKRYNDRHGHLLGDERLRACADWLAERARATPGASVYRYGGEEFATILAPSDPAAAKAYALTLCEGAERRFGADGTTLSVGVYCRIPEASADPLAWIAAVDGALYAAKHAGRNQVRIHPGDAVPAPERP